MKDPGSQKVSDFNECKMFMLNNGYVCPIPDSPYLYSWWYNWKGYLCSVMRLAPITFGEFGSTKF